MYKHIQDNSASTIHYSTLQYITVHLWSGQAPAVVKLTCIAAQTAPVA